MHPNLKYLSVLSYNCVVMVLPKTEEIIDVLFSKLEESCIQNHRYKVGFQDRAVYYSDTAPKFPLDSNMVEESR